MIWYNKQTTKLALWCKDNLELSIDNKLYNQVRVMLLLKVIIQLISIYRAVSIFIFILFYTVILNEINSFLLITSILSDLLDGYLAKRFKLTTTGGKLLDLFSDKYLNCISVIFLIIEQYPLLPLLMILTKEIFVLSFRSIEINGKFIISTNRIIGGFMSGILWSTVFLHINHVSSFTINGIVITLGIFNFLYLIYKIVVNISSLEESFKN